MHEVYPGVRVPRSKSFDRLFQRRGESSQERRQRGVT